MHETSYREILLIRDRLGLQDKKTLDIGSYDKNGTYKPLFTNYTGLDIESGPNVDIVSPHYTFPVEDNSYQLTLCGQTLEHTPDMLRLVKEIYRVTSETTILNAPMHFPKVHRYPVDCWRIFPDGMTFLLQEAGYTNIQVYTRKWKNRDLTDCIGIGYI